jgi:hypothetical protein
MSTLTRRKWDGILSLIWVAPGFIAFEFFGFEWWRCISSPALSLVLIFGAWWGFGMLMAISGSKSCLRISVFASLGTILFFIYFIWSALPRVHG